MKQRRYLSEDITKGEVHGIVKDNIDSMYNSRDFKKNVREIVADVLDDFFRNMYTRKGLWKNVL